MTDRACAHCGATYRRSPDTDPGEPDWTLCPDCADYAVLGGACPDCGDVPSGPCRDLATHLRYRALRPA